MAGASRQGQLVGCRLDPSEILDGIGDPKDETHIWAYAGLGSVPERISRPAFVAAAALGGILATTLASEFAGALIDRSVGETIRSLATLPLATATGIAATIKAMSFDRECDGRRFLVRKGPHVVSMRSYATLRAGEEANPVICVSIVHAILYKGTATKEIGGVHLSSAESYLAEVSPDGFGSAVVHAKSYLGDGEAHIRDCFEVPLSEVLGEWMEDASPWAWARPVRTGRLEKVGTMIGKADADEAVREATETAVAATDAGSEESVGQVAAEPSDAVTKSRRHGAKTGRHKVRLLPRGAAKPAV